jgi:hypothetical protein
VTKTRTDENEIGWCVANGPIYIAVFERGGSWANYCCVDLISNSDLNSHILYNYIGEITSKSLLGKITNKKRWPIRAEIEQPMQEGDVAEPTRLPCGRARAEQHAPWYIVDADEPNLSITATTTG